jgi:hypothetical protein
MELGFLPLVQPENILFLGKERTRIQVQKYKINCQCCDKEVLAYRPHQKYCKECRPAMVARGKIKWQHKDYAKNPEKYRSRAMHQSKARKIKNPQKWSARVRRVNLRAKWGITLQQLNQMFAKQNNKCAICDSALSMGMGKHAIDHDHKTDKIRQILCFRCNLILGHCKDSIDILLKAVEYLKKWENK